MPGGAQRWLSTVPVELEASGYLPGTGVVQWLQKTAGLEITTYAFAPRALARAGFALAVKVRNAGTATVHWRERLLPPQLPPRLRAARRGQNSGETGETVIVDTDAGKQDFIERGSRAWWSFGR